MVCRFELPEFLDILALTFGIIAVASFGFVFLAPGHGRMDWGSGAWDGIFQDKNRLAATMSLSIISLMSAFLHARPRKRIVLAGLIGMCVVLLAGSRSATATMGIFAAIGAGSGALVMRSPRIGNGGRIAIGLVTLVVAIAIAAVGVSPDTFFSALGKDSNLTGRTDFWPYLLQAISDRPVLGYGYDAFFRSAEAQHYLSYYVVESGGWFPYHAHNSFLQCSLDIGLGGLAVFGYVLIMALAGAVRFLRTDMRRVAGWPLAIVIYLIVGSFTETYFNQFNTFESILFVAAVLYPIRCVIAGKVHGSEGRPDR
jgi:O-antigen ligase